MPAAAGQAAQRTKVNLANGGGECKRIPADSPAPRVDRLDRQFEHLKIGRNPPRERIQNRGHSLFLGVVVSKPLVVGKLLKPGD